MDVDKTLEIIEKTERDFSVKNPIYCGLQILVEFSEVEVGIQFEHDQVWAGDFIETVKKMGEGAVKMMAKLGWFESEDSWSHFS